MILLGVGTEAEDWQGEGPFLLFYSLLYCFKFKTNNVLALLVK